LWWFADCIQYDNQRKLQKKHPRFFSERIHAPADSFISKNEGMNQLRDGSPGGQFMAVTLPDGTLLGNTNARAGANAGAGP
jgi:hypothetical protein